MKPYNNSMRVPLSEKLRPQDLKEIVGQDHLVGPHGFLTRLIAEKHPISLLFWGPPGTGKTTLASVYSKAFGAEFIPLSAVSTGIAELKKIVEMIKDQPLVYKQTIIFLDEIHRFNKAQQDFFLPHLEKGTFVLIGATTENPSFSLNNALLSRIRVLEVNPLGPDSLEKIIQRYEKIEKKVLPITPEARDYLIQTAQGDGRYILNMIESLPETKKVLNVGEMKEAIQKRSALFDRDGDYHYNVISALHKSVRGSDPDAALYWFCRMLEGGEDPLFLARRLIRMATEDIGLADPQALQLAMAAKQSYEHLGSPEGELGLAQVVVYLALAPKSNALYTAYKSARKHASETSHMSPPKIILNAPTRMMKNLGYGDGYKYDHDTEQSFSGQNYFPDGMERPEFYIPRTIGFEREMEKRMEYFAKLRKKLQSKED